MGTEYITKREIEEIKQIEEIAEIAALSEIINVLIKRRNSLGMSQRDLASECGIPQSSVSRIESMKPTPNFMTMLKILQPLGLEISVNLKE